MNPFNLLYFLILINACLYSISLINNKYISTTYVLFDDYSKIKNNRKMIFDFFVYGLFFILLITIPLYLFFMILNSIEYLFNITNKINTGIFFFLYFVINIFIFLILLITSILDNDFINNYDNSKMSIKCIFNNKQYKELYKIQENIFKINNTLFNNKKNRKLYKKINNLYKKINYKFNNEILKKYNKIFLLLSTLEQKNKIKKKHINNLKKEIKIFEKYIKEKNEYYWNFRRYGYKS